MTDAKLREWIVITPYGTRWRPKFSSEIAAWNRIVNSQSTKGEPKDSCKIRLQNAGWIVKHESFT